MSESLEHLTTIWESRGIAVADLVPDSSGTIGADTLLAAPRDAVAAAVDSTIELGDTLGEGGMAIVRSGIQVSLGREVAVKCLRPDRIESGRAASLVLEARVTGALEHPNIVPVHTLEHDADGNPIIIMKRIDGVAWSELLRDPGHPRNPEPGRAALDLHLEVLAEVCRAAHFAHSRGIVHRDLKPDNVMIGAFGEVYLLDWGVAVTTDESLGYGLPAARSVRTVAGTPHYMAPEMALADGDRIGPQSDVYLLGAILHECLCGTTRHQGDSVVDLLQAAYLSLPVEWPEGLPAELTAIVDRATRSDPTERFESAEAFRQALLAYRDHRGSTELAEDAGVRLQELAAALSSESPDLSEIRELFGACRFGYERALDSWPDNEPARRGLHRALSLMADFELSQGHPGAAAALIRRLEAPDSDLVERLETARARQGALDRLDRELDPVPGRPLRVRSALIIGAVFGVVFLLIGAGFRYWDLKPGLHVFAGGTALFVILMEVLAFIGRDAVHQTLVNRAALQSFRVLGAAFVALLTIGAVLGIQPTHITALSMLVTAVVFAMMSVWIESRLVWAAITFFLGALAAATFIEWQMEVLALTSVLGCTALALGWSGVCRDD